MSEMSVRARKHMHEKAQRLVRTDPKEKVDATSYTPPDPLDADVKTGMRPISKRQYKRGGAVHGEHAKHHAGKKPRKSGGSLTAKGIVDAEMNRDKKQANELRAGSKHVGGYADGGEVVPTERLSFGPSSGSRLTQAAGLKRGGRAHEDEAEDKALIRKEVKKSALRRADGGRTQTEREIDREHALHHLQRHMDAAQDSEDWDTYDKAKALHGRIFKDKNHYPEHMQVRKFESGEFARGGRSEATGAFQGQEPKGGREARAHGGRTKGKTNINIIIGRGHDAGAPVGMPMPPGAMPHPPVPPQFPPGQMPMGGMPPGGAPPMGGMPPSGPPPGAMPPPPMGRRSGGRTVAHELAEEGGGAGGGLGRLHKTRLYGGE